MVKINDQQHAHTYCKKHKPKRKKTLSIHFFLLLVIARSIHMTGGMSFKAKLFVRFV